MNDPDNPTSLEFTATAEDKAKALRGEPWALTGKREIGLSYEEFIASKSQRCEMHGFEPLWMPELLFGFQKAITEWNLRKGRSATFADCGLGKALRFDQRILTDVGWVPIGNVTTEMRAYGRDGLTHQITGVHPQGVRPIVRVVFSDGTFVRCDGDHLWYVESRLQRYRGRIGRVLTTEEIIRIGLSYRGGQKKHFVPLVQPITIDIEQNHIIDPHTLGVILGDGCISEPKTCVVTNPDLEFITNLRLPEQCRWSIRESGDKCPCISVVGGDTWPSENPFITELYRLGLQGSKAEHKYIPEQYMRAAPNDRHAILQGLLDTDGSTSGPCVEYSTASPQLSSDVCFLVRSLGGTCTQSRERAAYTKHGVTVECQDRYRSIIKLPSTFPPFRLPSKVVRYQPRQRREPFKNIVAIEVDGRAEAVCISTEAPDSLFVTEGMTLTHNSPMSLVFARNVVMKTKKPVLILTPIAVGLQLEAEGDKFDIEAKRSKSGKPSCEITITNYEKLHLFDPSDYGGVVCDESSCIKDAKAETRSRVTEFLKTIPYRLLCTATAAPNDFHELGTSSEALGELGYRDMITKFFKQEQNVYKHNKGWGRTKYRFREHAKLHFWRWICSWARACRKPSDLGFPDDDFLLPSLHVKEHVVKASRALDGMLFSMPAGNLQEERQERRQTINERCDWVAERVKHNDPVVVWCHLNDEGDMLEKKIPDAIQVSGKDTDDSKEEKLTAFSSGSERVLIIKPKIGAWGMNWQHCNRVITFPSHSFEQYYQSIRRCWRFGQEREVFVDIVLTEGEQKVLANLQRKSGQADEMFTQLVAEMNQSMSIDKAEIFSESESIPGWLR